VLHECNKASNKARLQYSLSHRVSKMILVATEN